MNRAIVLLLWQKVSDIMKKQIVRLSFVILGILSLSANADPIVYEIESYSSGNYSASWLHSADYCSGQGPQSGVPLCMGGNILKSISGTIEGNLDLVTNALDITGGQLTIGDDVMGYTVHDVLVGGILSPFNNNVSTIIIEDLGTFFFEDIGMGAGGPNYFDGQEFVLWGQNIGAYICAAGTCDDDYDPWGIDLYGQAVAVPEPGTLILFGLGLLGIGWTRRKTA